MKDKPVKVFFDNCIFSIQKIGGISVVFAEIIKRLKTHNEITLTIIENADANNNLLYNESTGHVLKQQEAKINKALLPFFPLLTKLPAYSIFHSTYNRFSLQKDLLKVTTIHDLGYERKIMQKGLKRQIHLFFKRKAIMRANAVICVSENTRKDLMLFYGDVLQDKIIKVIDNGIDDQFLNYKIDLEKSCESRYLLYVGARHQYKNFDSIVYALSESDEFKLMICGSSLTRKEQEFLDCLLPNRYDVVTNVKTHALINLYAGAFCLLYPSSYEGFGLPVLEAMACGCPVIACDNSSIPQIAGGAAILIKDAKPSSMIKALSQLQDSAYRKSLIKKGKLNSQRYSWTKTADQTAKLYMELKFKNIKSA